MANITGGSGNDLLNGTADPDSILGVSGDDTINGGGGQDTIEGGVGSDTVDGGDGNDLIIGDIPISVNTELDSEQADNGFSFGALEGWFNTGSGGLIERWGNGVFGVFSTDGSSFVELDVNAGGAVDHLQTNFDLADGLEYTFTFEAAGRAGPGQNDSFEVTHNGVVVATITPASINSFTSYSITLTGTAGVDTIGFRELASQNDSLGPLLDNMHIGLSQPQIDALADSFNDSLLGGAGDDTIEGNEGNDTLIGGNGRDSLEGGSGDDFIDSFAGSVGFEVGGDQAFNADTIDGGSGNDTIIGGFGRGEEIDGGSGTDLLSFQPLGVASAANINLVTGNYTLGTGGFGIIRNVENVIGTFGNDSITGDDGNNFLGGGFGNDTILGGGGNDTILGDSGADSLIGGAGSDDINGGTGSDTLNGGVGNDVLTGGADADVFEYEVGSGADTITDFTAADGDTIDLSTRYDTLFELWADYADDGTLNQSNTLDTKGNAVDYSDNTQFGVGESLNFTGATADSATFNTASTGVVCFTPGAIVQTATGPRLIQDLRIGDLVQTRDNGFMPILWIGGKTLASNELVMAPHLKPIQVKAGMFGLDRDLVVSPQHGMLVKSQKRGGDEILVRAKHLAEMTGARAREMRGCRSVTYIHLLLESHQLLQVNGCWSESLYPGPMALKTMSAGALSEIQTLFPQLPGANDVVDAYGQSIRPYQKRRTLPKRFDHLLAA